MYVQLCINAGWKKREKEDNCYISIYYMENQVQNDFKFKIITHFTGNTETNNWQSNAEEMLRNLVSFKNETLI